MNEGTVWVLIILKKQDKSIFGSPFLQKFIFSLSQLKN